MAGEKRLKETRILFLGVEIESYSTPRNFSLFPLELLPKKDTAQTQAQRDTWMPSSWTSLDKKPQSSNNR